MAFSIKIIFPGGIKESLLEELLKKYIRFSQKYGLRLVPVFLKEIKLGDDEKKKQKESEMILRNIDDDAYVVVLDVFGKQLSSEGFSDFIGKRRDEGKKIIFVIAGAFGPSEDLRRRANYLFSLSNLTFPHEVAGMLLSEQIFRAFSILHGGEYHK